MLLGQVLCACDGSAATASLGVLSAVLGVALIAVVRRQRAPADWDEPPDPSGFALPLVTPTRPPEPPAPLVLPDPPVPPEAFERALEESASLILTLERGRIDRFNRICEQISGYEQAEVTGKTLASLLVPESHMEALERHLAEPLDPVRLARPTRMPWITRDGRRRVIEWRMFPYSSPGGGTGLLATGTDVSERLEVEHELATLRAYMNATFQTSPYGIITLDRDGNVTQANRGAIATFGSEGDLEGINLRTEGAAPELTFAMTAAYAGRPAQASCRSIPGFGPRQGHFQVHLLPIRRESGELLGISLVCHDQTAQTHTEQALRESEQRYRFLMDNLSEMLVVVQNGQFGYVSEGARSLLGYEPGELAGRSLLAAVAPEHREGVRCVLSDGLRSGPGSSVVHEFQMLRKDHGRVWVEMRPQLATWQSRTAVIGVLTNISARHAIDEKLRFQAAIIEQMTDWVIVADMDARITFVSPAVERSLGFGRDELVGLTVEQVYARIGLLGTTTPREMAAAVEESGAWHGSVRLVGKDGHELTYDLNVSAMRDASGLQIAMLALGRDVTEQANLEAQLRQAQKMEAIGQLAGGVAHDFNNILVAIKGYSQLAAAQLDEADAVRADLLQIDEAASRAAELTRQLLAFSRRQVATPRPTDLNAIVQNFGRMLRRMIGEKVHLRIEALAERAIVMMDPNQVELVLMNLAVNARDAMPEGGHIVIGTFEHVTHEDVCRLNGWAHPGRYVGLSVSDTGTGMAPDVREKAFEPFFTTKELGRGTGLGLATVYGIINQNNGLIDLESRIGEGTTFRFYFPATDQALGVELQKPPAAKGGAETVLVAEDEAPVLKLARRILTGAGYNVLTATNGREAVDVVAQHGEAIDLLIFDVVMPEMGGKEALDAIRAMGYDIPALFCSGYSVGEIHTDFVINEGIHLLGKPYSPADLLGRARALIDDACDGAERIAEPDEDVSRLSAVRR